MVIGRDPAEPNQIIGKQFLLRVWLINVGGPGMQHIRIVRVGADGNIALAGIAPIKAEGTTIAATETAVATAYKASSPTASAWISIIDRKPPPPPSTTQTASTQPTTAPAK